MTTDMQIALTIIVLAMLACLIGWIIFGLRREKKRFKEDAGALLDELNDSIDYPGDIPDIDYD